MFFTKIWRLVLSQKLKKILVLTFLLTMKPNWKVQKVGMKIYRKLFHLFRKFKQKIVEKIKIFVNKLQLKYWLKIEIFMKKSKFWAENEFFVRISESVINFFHFRFGIGLPANLVVILITLYNWRNRQASSWLVLNLAFSDLCLCKYFSNKNIFSNNIIF